MRIFEASKSKLRSAKAKIWQSELDDIQKNDGASATTQQELKRELIKGAYTEQLNAIVEFGKKLQIIGEHGLQLLEHIDVPGAASDGSVLRPLETVHVFSASHFLTLSHFFYLVELKVARRRIFCSRLASTWRTGTSW